MKKIFCFLTLLLSITCFSQVDNDSIVIEKLLDQAKRNQAKLKYDETYRILLEALTIARKNNYRALEFKTEITIANMYLMKGEISQAKDFFENKFPNPSYPKAIQSYYYHRKAFYYNQSRNNKQALVTAYKGVEIAKENNFIADLISLYNEIAYIHEHQNNLNVAIDFYNKALSLSDNFITQSNITLNKARIYTKMSMYNNSNLLLNEVLKMIDTTEYYEIKTHLYGSFSYNFQMLGDSTNYYKYRYLNVNEALKAQKAHSESQYKDLQVKYQIKEKDALIDKKNAQQKELMFLIFGITVLFLLAGLLSIYTRNKNKSLTKLLYNNNFLLSELNHRTKNNLQLIVSLANRESKKNINDKLTGIVNLTSKIESIATLHQQLYLNEKLDYIQLKSYIEEILVNLTEFLNQNKIEVIKEIDSVEIGANQPLYMGLLINELVVNSIKHAFPTQDNKKIELSIKIKDKYLEIQYRDNGVGVPENSKVKLISTLSRQLEADFMIENRNGFCYFAKIKI